MSNQVHVLEHDEAEREIAGNAPLLLTDATMLWEVTAGHVNVFAVVLAQGEPAGERQYLCRVDTGALLMGCAAPEGAPSLVAVGAVGTRVRQLPIEHVRAMAADEALNAALGAKINDWVQSLTSGVARGAPPRTALRLEPGREVRLRANASVTPSKVLWIETPPVECLYQGTVPVSLNREERLFPLAGQGWLQSPVPVAMRGLPIETAVSDPRLWTGLAAFHAAVLACAAINGAAAAQAERERLELKHRSEVAHTREMIRDLATSARVQSEDGAADEFGHDPLLNAFLVIGTELGVPIRAPQNQTDRSLSEPVNAIARASGLRVRRVKLAGPWWTNDAGPLLSYRADDERPVALLWTSKGYVQVDPQHGERVLITASNHHQLAGFAYSTYRSFPARSLSLRGLMEFGLRGTGSDWGVVITLGVLGSLAGLFVPVATGWIVSDVIPTAGRQQLWLLVMALIANAIAMAMFEFVQSIAMLRIESRMDGTVEAGVWDRLLQLPASFFRQFAAGDLTMRAMGIGGIRQTITDAVMSSALSFAFSFVAFGLLFYYDPRLALVATLLFIGVIAATCVAVMIQLPLERRQYELSGRVAALVLQLLTGISRLRVAGAESRALAHWAEQYGRQMRGAYRAQRVSNGLGTLLAVVPVMASVVVFAVVALWPTPSLSVAAFLAFSVAFTQVMGAAIQMSSTISSALDVVPLYERARPILETLPEASAARMEPPDLTGAIEISHVSFRYQAGGRAILDDVSLKIAPGEFVAFVGPSGAGKSTILRLLLGFEVPESGSVYYDREDLQHLNRQAVRRQIGTVFQNSRLSSGDLFRNIVGSAPLTLDDAWEAAKLSGLDEDIKHMPMGMHTVISDGESTLSGGQRQRLMIARAIATKPKILLFDEATSALDNLTQAKVARSLESLNATRIVVAHRVSTIVNADRICVIDGGKIVQQGTYTELAEAPGLFATLIKRQLL